VVAGAPQGATNRYPASCPWGTQLTGTLTASAVTAGESRTVAAATPSRRAASVKRSAGRVYGTRSHLSNPPCTPKRGPGATRRPSFPAATASRVLIASGSWHHSDKPPGGTRKLHSGHTARS